MRKKLFIVLLLASLATFLFGSWWQWSSGAVNTESQKTKIFVIKKGEGIRQIGRRLQEEGLIRSKLAFFLLVKNKGAEKNIQAGTFRLSAAMPLEAILKELSHGTLDIWVTVIEGWRNEEIARLLEKELNFPSQDFLKVAKIGYMFPDTYAFPKEATPGAVAKIMLSNFERKFDQRLKEAAQREGLTEEETIILASIVEREARYTEDRPMVARILLNRLRQEMPLQADATVQYAKAMKQCDNVTTRLPDGQVKQCDWWPKSLTKEDLKIESPYNTYINVGLPLTPISNPGLAAIEAVAYPAQTDDLYYLSDKEGKMHYAQTLEEHNENIRKYLSN